MPVYTVIEPDGTTRRVETTATGAKLMAEVRNAIGADAIEPLHLPNGSVWLLPHAGAAKGLPVNPVATRRYQATHQGNGGDKQIRGTVVIAADLDFGG